MAEWSKAAVLKTAGGLRFPWVRILLPPPERKLQMHDVHSASRVSNINIPQNKSSGFLGTLVVGLYAWVATVSFGIVLIDIKYARSVPEATVAFSEVADFLLLVSAASVLVALAAIGVSWNSRIARNFLIASLLFSLFGLFVPVLLSPFLHDGSALGAGIRLIISGTISLLAFMGFYKF